MANSSHRQGAAACGAALAILLDLTGLERGMNDASHMRAATFS
jgi:hypothetical protein